MSAQEPSKLNPRQRLFVEHYVSCWNATKAARLAGYSEKGIGQTAHNLLKNTEIRAAIQAHLDDVMPAGEVLTRLAKQARGSMGDFLRVDEEEITLTWSLMRVPTNEDGEADVESAMLTLAMQENVTPTDRVLRTATVKRSVARLDLLAAGQAGKLDLVKKYSLDDKGKVSIELYDAQGALVQLGKYHKLWTDKQEHSGPDGGPIPISIDAADLAAARAKAQQWESEQFGPPAES